MQSDAVTDSENILAAVRAEVLTRMAAQQAGHGIDHVQRVVSAAKAIQQREGGDLFVVELAAWLHDIGDAKFNEGVERSGEFSREILEGHSLPRELIDHVVHIVDNLSFRKRATAQPLSLEGQIVQDADRIDALGAVGIVRTIEYGASKQQPFYDASRPVEEGETGIGHFYQKLFLLRELLNTETAKAMAAEREAFMRNFVDQFLSEVRVEE